MHVFNCKVKELYNCKGSLCSVRFRDSLIQHVREEIENNNFPRDHPESWALLLSSEREIDYTQYKIKKKINEILRA